MAARLNVVVFMLMVAAAVLQSSKAQTRHVVGDGQGWTIPPNGAAAYSTWASSQTFAVGDVLVFNFATGAHDVAEVTRADYGPCISNNTIGSVIRTAPATINLNTPGQHFYICNFPQHCASGQKLAINVTGTAATPPSKSPAASPPPSIATPPSGSAVPSTPPSPSPSGSSATPPTENSAPSFAIGLPITLLSIALAFLY